MISMISLYPYELLLQKAKLNKFGDQELESNLTKKKTNCSGPFNRVWCFSLIIKK